MIKLLRHQQVPILQPQRLLTNDSFITCSFYRTCIRCDRKSFPQSITEFFTEFTAEYCCVRLCEHTLCNPVGGILPDTQTGNPLLQVLAMSLLTFLSFNLGLQNDILFNQYCYNW